MTITYSCIARGTTVLCKHQVGLGTLQSTVDSMLPNIPTRNDGKTTYKSENYLFHCLIENGLIYMCAATPQFGKKQPYNYLAEIKRKFQSGMLSMKAVSAGHLELNDEFSLIMAQEMKKFSKPDNVTDLQLQVDDVKVAVEQNVRRLFERDICLDKIADKTEDLENRVAEAFPKAVPKTHQVAEAFPKAVPKTHQVAEAFPKAVPKTHQVAEAFPKAVPKTHQVIKKKSFLGDMKMKIIIIVVVVTVIIVVIVMIILATQGVFDGSSNNSPSPNTTQATIQNG